MTHIMVDLETWGTAPGCDIRSIGAVVFDPVAGTLGATFYVNVENPLPYGPVMVFPAVDCVSVYCCP